MPLLAACQTGPREIEWRHMVGSNADDLWVTEALFHRGDKLVNGSTNGSAGYVDVGDLKNRQFFWHIGKGRSTVAPVPDRMSVEWISFYDKKRYGITLPLPSNLETMLAQRYRVKVGNEWRIDRRKNIGIGMAPGGYVEVFLTSVYTTPDILLARGMAKEITDDAYPYDYPLAHEYKETWEKFDQEFGEAYRQYPIPTGMAWAPIMDGYRAAQPKTDTEPVN
jgi:hypothetical protein